MLIFSCVIICLFCFIQPFVRATTNIRQLEKKILDSIIGTGYDSRIRPNGLNVTTGLFDDGPAIIRVNILVRSISKIDDVTMEYSAQLTFRQQWVDDRLKFDTQSGKIGYLVLTEPDKIWRPDLFFSNEKQAHDHVILMPNVLLRIYPDGRVLYSIRISLVLSCPMHLKYFPLDIQTCSIKMASYGYTTEDLVFLWKEGDPVQVTKNLHLPKFTLQKFETKYCTSRTNTGEYSCLKIDLFFKREFSYYLIQIYIPCCMLVIVSWVSFWIDPNSTAARVALGVTTLLTMANKNASINSSLPPVSYTKAIDVWTGVCLTFVFGALLEFAMVNYASRSDASKAAKKQKKNQAAAIQGPPGNGSGGPEKCTIVHANRSGLFDFNEPLMDATPFVEQCLVKSGAGGPNSRGYGDYDLQYEPPRKSWLRMWVRNRCKKLPSRSKLIDVVARIVFPIMFTAFNMLYWTTYLLRDDLKSF